VEWITPNPNSGSQADTKRSQTTRRTSYTNLAQAQNGQPSSWDYFCKRHPTLTCVKKTVVSAEGGVKNN